MFCLISAAELVGVKIWYAHWKALGMRMRKLVLVFSVAQILPEKINKMDFLNSLEFIDVSQTVPGIFFIIFIIPDNLVLGPMKICSLEKCPLLQFFRYFAVRYFEFLLHNSQEGGRNYFSILVKFYKNMKIGIKWKQYMKFHWNMMLITTKKWRLKILQITTCLTEGGIYEVKKGVKES